MRYNSSSYDFHKIPDRYLRALVVDVQKDRVTVLTEDYDKEILIWDNQYGWARKRSNNKKGPKPDNFFDLVRKGDLVTLSNSESMLEPYIPCYIVKKNQILVSISALDFSFMVENNISFIFQKLHDYQLKVNLIQNSAISFSVCIDNKFNKFDEFYNELEHQFKIDVQKNVDLYTIRHFDDNAIELIENKGESLLTQVNKETSQIVIKPN